MIACPVCIGIVGAETECNARFRNDTVRVALPAKYVSESYVCLENVAVKADDLAQFRKRSKVACA